MKKGMVKGIDQFHSELEYSMLQLTKQLLCSRSYQDGTFEFVRWLTFFYSEIPADELKIEILILRIQLKAVKKDLNEAKDWVSLDFLSVIVEWDILESLPNLTFEVVFDIIYIFCVNKVFQIESQSILGQAKLCDLAILSIKCETGKKADFDDEVINDFVALKVRKVDIYNKTNTVKIGSFT